MVKSDDMEECKMEEQPMEEENENRKTDDSKEQAKESFMDAAKSERLRPFVIISSSYLLFTITDGALRMIVLLHAYNENFSAFEVALMFTLYELAGVVTNLAAGVMGAKWGIRFTLLIGLSLQLVSYALLFGWQEDWDKSTSIIYVTVAQLFAGVAKDLTKLGGKTVTKLVTPEEQETKLFKLVSLITGWKNSLKGVGYFLGSALISVSYELALAVMMGIVALAIPWAAVGLDSSLGTAKKSNASWSDVFNLNNRNLNILSLARLFLFASRDFWFEVPLPFFLRSPGCDGLGVDECMDNGDCGNGAICSTNEMIGVCQNINSGGGCGGLGLDRVVVGAFLGGYIILYGQVQSWTPQLVTGPLNQTPPNKLTEVLWGVVNCLPTLVMTFVLAFAPVFDDNDVGPMTAWMVTGIVTFAVIFAINSSIHSYLVVKYASTDKIAVSVGFYYMSNAMGRLFGTLGSGLLYTYVGDDKGDLAGNDAVAALAACFLAGTLSSLTAAVITTRIQDHEAGLKCGRWTLVKGTDEDDEEAALESKPKARAFPFTGNRPYHLVIVESPNQAEEMASILAEYVKENRLRHDYLVRCTMGPIRELAKKPTNESGVPGVDIENRYQPTFDILPGKESLVAELRSLAHEAKMIVFATDSDRDGEALAWHLKQVLPKYTPQERIILTEVTPVAIKMALENPQPSLDMNSADSAITQAIQDRLVECTLAPVLEKNIAPGLSVGHLESVALELIVQRERERLAFQSKQCWVLKAEFGHENDLEAQMVECDGVSFATESDFDTSGALKDSTKECLTQDGADKVMSVFGEGDASPILRDPDISHWTVTSVKSNERKIAAPRPFTTATLLQQSYERLAMSVSETMEAAQLLYDFGCITFMRTNGNDMNQAAHRAAEAVVTEHYGANMLAPPRRSSSVVSMKKLQEPSGASSGEKEVDSVTPAEEAVRPIVQLNGRFMAPEQLPVDDPSATRLYELIYQRTLASRMKAVVINQTSVEIAGKCPKEESSALFRASGSVVARPGYTLAWRRPSSDPVLPALETGQVLECTKMHLESCSTQPRPRYTESTIIKELDTELMGRPNTFAKIIYNLSDWGYVGKPAMEDAYDGIEGEEGEIMSGSYRTVNGEGSESYHGPLVPSLSAIVVSSFLEKNLSTLLDPAIAASMQKRLDEAALGTGGDSNFRASYLDEFYAGEDGLAARVKRTDQDVNPEIARIADIPASFVNNAGEMDGIGFFISPEGPYAKKVFPVGTPGAENSPTLTLPPDMAADVSSINTQAVRELLAAREDGGLIIGPHYKDGRNIRLRVGRFGAYLQWGMTGAEGTTTHSLLKQSGELDSVCKRTSAESGGSLNPGEAIGLTLDDAIGYVNLPREVCTLNDKPIVTAIGPYGPYLKYDHTYTKLNERDGDVLTVDPETATRIVTEEIINYESEHGKRVVAELGRKRGSMVRVKDGRYAMKQVCWRDKRAPIPTEFQDNPKDMPLAIAWALIKETEYKKSRPKPPKSAYLFFCSEKRPEATNAIKSSTDNSETAARAGTSIELARMWQEWQETATNGGRQYYEDLAASDIVRYEEEMALYQTLSPVGMSVSATSDKSPSTE